MITLHPFTLAAETQDATPRPEVGQHYSGSLHPVVPPAQPVYMDLVVTTFDTSLVGQRLAEDPSTQILICVCLIDDHTVIWLPRLNPQESATQVVSVSCEESGPAADVCSRADVPDQLMPAVRSGRTCCARGVGRMHTAIWKAASGIPAPGR